MKTLENIPSELMNPLIENQRESIKRGIWLLFFLLIFEGALRKWFLPQLATPLLIVRDPITLWLVYKAWKEGILKANYFLTGMILIGTISIFTAVLLGHENWPVAIYGARILLIHFPLIFVIGNVFDREDVIKMGIVTIWISIPMTILMGLQYFSPQSAWVNLGVGGDAEGAGFNAGAHGFYRPSGTFSFTVGLVHFYNFVACFILYYWFRPKEINIFILLAATFCLLAAIPLSIARSLLLGVGVSFMFLFIPILRNPEYLWKMIPVILVFSIVLSVLSSTEFFQVSIEAFSSRIETANNIEGGMEGVIGNRYIGGMIEAISGSSDLPFFGHGMGMGTNVGSMLLTGGTSYLIAEEEWGRVIGEMGALLGILVIFLRLGLCAKIAFACYQKLINGDLLPWLLLSFCLLIVPQGQWARPTTLGFAILIAGLTIASLKTQYKSNLFYYK